MTRPFPGIRPCHDSGGTVGVPHGAAPPPADRPYDRPMSLFAVHYTYSDDTAARDEHRPAHREFLGDLAREGVVVLSGPYATIPEAPDAALLVLRGESAAQLVELLRDDPFQQQGLVEQVAVREWTPVLGSWAEGPLADEL